MADHKMECLPPGLCELRGRVHLGWEFLSFSDMKRFSKRRLHMVPVAMVYRGLGLMNVIEYVPSKEGYFMHVDGGSNGYDRTEHAHTWNNYIPEDHEIVRGEIDEVIAKFEERM